MDLETEAIALVGRARSPHWITFVSEDSNYTVTKSLLVILFD
jgi:hypothetical protein